MNNENKELDTTFLRKIIVSLGILLVSIFSFIKNDIRVEAADVEPVVTVQGTYNNGPDNEHALMSGDNAIYTESRGDSNPVVKITISNIDRRVHTIHLGEYKLGDGQGHEIYTIANTENQNPECDPCALVKPTNDSRIIEGSFQVTYENGYNEVSLLYKVQQEGFGIKDLTFTFIGLKDIEKLIYLEIEPKDGKTTVVKELDDSFTYFEPDVGDYNNRKSVDAYNIGARQGQMGLPGNGKTEGTHAYLNSLTYSGGNTDGKTPTNEPITINLSALGDIAIADITINKYIYSSEDVQATLNITDTVQYVATYDFNTAEFVDKNGYYDIVITDVFGNTHTLTFVIDSITKRDITIGFEYFFNNLENQFDLYVLQDSENNYWTNQDVIIKVTVSTTNDFILGDIDHDIYGGYFNVKINSVDIPIKIGDTTTHNNYIIGAYSLTEGKFVVLITVKENETFSFEFEDRYGNKATNGTEITRIDKVAPVIFGNDIQISSTGTLTRQPLTINASTMFNNNTITPGHNSAFTNNYLLNTAFALTSGTYTITETDNNAGFREGGMSYLVSYYKADGTTPIGTHRGYATGATFFADVTKELFEGRNVIIKIELQDYFPYVDTILGVDKGTNGNPTYAELEISVEDDVAPIIFWNTEAAKLNQEADTQILKTPADFIAHHINYVWDNQYGNYSVAPGSFEGFVFDGEPGTYSATFKVGEDTHLTIEVDLTQVDPTVSHPGYEVTITVNDENNNSNSGTVDYEILRRQILIAINPLAKTYGEADALGYGTGTLFYDYSSNVTEYQSPLESYGLKDRMLFRETGIVGGRNYQEVLPEGYVYKFYQYWVNGETETDNFTRINACNVSGGETTCPNGLVSDANHEINFAVLNAQNGTYGIYKTLADYYNQIGNGNAGTTLTSDAYVGLTINRLNSIVVTPKETNYEYTYGTAVEDADLTFSMTGMVEDNTNGNSTTQTAIFGDTLLTTKDKRNVTENLNNTKSNNKGYLELTLEFAKNTWLDYNYGFSADNKFIEHVGYDNLVYASDGITPTQMITIIPATLTVSPELGQYKDIDHISSAYPEYKVQGYGGIKATGEKTVGTTLSKNDKYLFTATGWKYDDKIGEGWDHEHNYIFGNISVNFTGGEKVLIKEQSTPLYNGYLYTIGDLTYSDNGYNNYVFELEDTYVNPGNDNINKKFVIIKVGITIVTNDFEMIYGTIFSSLNKTSGDQDASKAMTGPAISIYRTDNDEVKHGNALMSEGQVINSLEDLADSITLNLEDFYNIERIPAGLYKLEVTFSDNINNVRDNFDFTFVNEGTLEVKSKTVYVTANDSYTKVYGEADVDLALGVYTTINGTENAILNGDTLAMAFNPIFTYGTGETAKNVYILRTASEDVGTHNFLPDTAVDNIEKNPVLADYTRVIKGEDITFANYRADTVETYSNYTALASEVIRTYTITKAPLTATALDITKVYGDHDNTALLKEEYSGTGTVVNNLEGCANNGLCDYPYVLDGIIESGTIFVNYQPDGGTLGETSITDDISVVSGKLVRAQGEDAGTYLLAAGDLASNNNYSLDINLNGAKLEITKRHLTVYGHHYVLNSLYAEEYDQYLENAIEYYNDIETDSNLIFEYSVPNLATYANGSVVDDTLTTVFTGSLKWDTENNTTTTNLLQTIYVSDLELVEGVPGSNYTFDPQDDYVPGHFVIIPVDIEFIVHDNEKIYGEDDTQSTYKVSFTGSGRILTEGDKTTIFGETNPTIEDGVYVLTPDQLTIAINLFNLKFAREVGTGDQVGTYSIYLKGGKIGYNSYVRNEGVENGRTLLNNDAGLSLGYILSDATFTVNARPVNIYALPYDGVFNNSAPQALGYCLTKVEGLTREDLITDFTCASGWVSETITVHDWTADGGTTTVSVTDSNSLLDAATAMYRVYGDDNKVVTNQEEIVAAGTTTVKFDATKLNELKNYQIAVNETTYIITPKAITVTADNKQKIYGEADPEFTFTVDGCVDGDTSCIDRTEFSQTISRETGETVGTYTISADSITVKPNAIGHVNYSLITDDKNDGTLTINRRPIVLTVNKDNDLFTKTYGDATGDFTYAGFSVKDYIVCSTETLEDCGLVNNTDVLETADTIGGLGIQLFRFSGETQITEGATADDYEDVDSYPLKFVWTGLNQNYTIKYQEIDSPTITVLTDNENNPYDTGAVYKIEKRPITITVTGESANQTIEQRVGDADGEVARLTGLLDYDNTTENGGRNNITVSNMDNMAVRTSDKLQGKMCYANVDSDICAETVDYEYAGTYWIVKGSLLINGNSAYESQNYDVTIEFKLSETETLAHGILTISFDETPAVFYVGNKLEEETLTNAAILDIEDLQTFFATIKTSPHTGYQSQSITRGRDSENTYSFNLRTLFSLQAYDYFSGSTNQKQSLDDQLTWLCEVIDGETIKSCATAFYNNKTVGKYTVRFTVYDYTYVTKPSDNSTKGNPNSIEGTIYLVDIKSKPTTGTLNVYNNSVDGELIATSADEEERTIWVNGTGGIYFNIAGGSDNSFTDTIENSQWWHRFSLDGGNTWYDYVSGEALVKVLDGTHQGQVTIIIESYDNRRVASTRNNREWSENDLFSDEDTFFGDNYDVITGNPYAYSPVTENPATNFGVTRTYTIVVDNTAPQLGITSPITQAVIGIEIPLRGEETRYVEKGFNPTDTIDASTDVTKIEGYNISISNPVGSEGETGIKIIQMRIVKGDGEVLAIANSNNIEGYNPTSKDFWDIVTNTIIYEYKNPIFRQYQIYTIEYLVIDNSGNETRSLRGVYVIDLRPQWMFVEDTTGDQQAAVQSFMETQSYSIGVNTPFTMPNLITVNNTGNNLNLAIRQVIRYEGKEVNEIDTSLPGTYTISYDATGGEHNLAARTLELKLNVLQTQDVSKVVISNVNSNMLLYLTACLGLLFIGLSFSYLTLRKKEN